MVNTTCPDCTLCTRALSTINCYFDFVNNILVPPNNLNALNSINHPMSSNSYANNPVVNSSISEHLYTHHNRNTYLCNRDTFSKTYGYSYTNHNYVSNIICNSNLKIFYQNVRGLKTKLINIRCAFPIFFIYDVIVLTETWLSPDIKDAELGFVGFRVYRLDRNPNNSSFSRGGGVLIAIKSSLKSHPVPLNVSNVKQVYAVMSINTNNFLVGCIPTSCSTSYNS